jgi:hypothetical protein
MEGRLWKVVYGSSYMRLAYMRLAAGVCGWQVPGPGERDARVRGCFCHCLGVGCSHAAVPSRFSGLENMIPNSYVNAWIHTAFFITPLRAHMLNQLSSKEVPPAPTRRRLRERVAGAGSRRVGSRCGGPARRAAGHSSPARRAAGHSGTRSPPRLVAAALCVHVMCACT